MTRKTKIAMLCGALAAFMMTNTAKADLMGDQQTITITHAGMFAGLSALNNASHTYGGVSLHTVPGWGSVTMASPGPAPGMDNAIFVDFTAFNYSAFTGNFATLGTILIQDIDEPVDISSVKVLVNGGNIGMNIAAVGTGFKASWNTQTLFSGNPNSPNMTVAWNSMPVPAPGAMALLGLAGIIGRRGRRRA